MSILNKLNNIKIDEKTEKEIEHLDRGLNQEDYSYMTSSQKEYEVAFDLWKEYFDKIKLSMIEIDGELLTEQIVNSNVEQKYDKHSNFSNFIDYSIVQKEWLNMNIYFITHCVNYFNNKYHFIDKSESLNLYDVCKKQFDRKTIEKIDYKYILNFMQKKYGFIPQQKET